MSARFETTDEGPKPATLDQGICEHGGSMHDCLALHPVLLTVPDPED